MYEDGGVGFITTGWSLALPGGADPAIGIPGGSNIDVKDGKDGGAGCITPGRSLALPWGDFGSRVAEVCRLGWGGSAET
jgi:hypothetical protein